MTQLVANLFRQILANLRSSVSRRLYQLVVTGAGVLVGSAVGLGAFCSSVLGATSYTVSSQVGALAPNAGGQQAYSLRLASSDWELGAFSNQYLLAGSAPLSGLTADWRFAVCDSSCFWQVHLHLGGGFSNGGPIAQITWSAMIPMLPIWLPIETIKYLPLWRLDVTTQMIAIRYRAVTWSYPLWIGVAVPF